MAEWETGIERLKAAYREWNASKGRSVDTWLALLAHEVDFRSLANGGLGIPWTRTRKSPAEVKDYLLGLTSDFEMQHYTVDRYVCEGDTIVALGSTGWRHRRTGRAFDTPKVDVWRFRDGKAISYFEFYDTAAVGATAVP